MEWTTPLFILRQWKKNSMNEMCEWCCCCCCLKPDRIRYDTIRSRRRRCCRIHSKIFFFLNSIQYHNHNTILQSQWCCGLYYYHTIHVCVIYIMTNLNRIRQHQHQQHQQQQPIKRTQNEHKKNEVKRKKIRIHTIWHMHIYTHTAMKKRKSKLIESQWKKSQCL